MPTRANYWACSKFADWIRGTPKPGSATAGGWHDWKRAAKLAHPIRYWIADDGLDYAQDFVNWPLDQLHEVKYYINNRWISRTHALTARSLKVGQWHEFDTRILHCSFDELVEFVEVEQAWMHLAWGGKEIREKYEAPFWATGWFRWRTWRCPRAGIDYLNWCMTLTSEWLEDDHPDRNKPSPQAEKAKEEFALYDWWKNIRPARPDPYKTSGWSDLCDKRRKERDDDGLWEDRTPEESQESKDRLEALNKIEEQYEQEDTDMLIRLIKIRRSLWT